MSGTEPDHWDHNEHGAWCPACGNLVAAPWQLMEAPAPHDCDECGFPDFEDGGAYFTEDEI